MWIIKFSFLWSAPHSVDKSKFLLYQHYIDKPMFVDLLNFFSCLTFLLYYPAVDLFGSSWIFLKLCVSNLTHLTLKASFVPFIAQKSNYSTDRRMNERSFVLLELLSEPQTYDSSNKISHINSFFVL